MSVLADEDGWVVEPGGSWTIKSLISVALKIIYSYTSSLGAMGFSTGRFSVPKDRAKRKKEQRQEKSSLIYLNKRLNKMEP